MSSDKVYLWLRYDGLKSGTAPGECDTNRTSNDRCEVKVVIGPNLYTDLPAYEPAGNQ